MPIELTSDTAREIPLQVGSVSAEFLAGTADEVNERLRSVQSEFADLIDIFEVIDLRMLSGMVGELYAKAISEKDPRLVKNPNIDGYPDLCDVSVLPASEDLTDYLNYPSGGIEIKNTFGLKKAGIFIAPGESRRGKIAPTLVWKAHHQYTNNLLAIQSDYIEGVPQIVRGFFASELEEDDWTVKQNPGARSTMTSFCQTRRSAFLKLKAGEMFRLEEYDFA